MSARTTWSSSTRDASSRGDPPSPARNHQGTWRWALESVDSSRTRVTHTYDWTELTDESRLPRARATTADKLQASLDRLADLAALAALAALAEAD